MLIKGLVDEDFIQYKLPSMFIITSKCSFKCCKEVNRDICQNSELASGDILEVDNDELCKRYLQNQITKAIVFGGLEPLDTFDDTYAFIKTLRDIYACIDPVVIYTGYYEYEVESYILELSKYRNIIMKFGRFIPDSDSKYDPLLGVILASDNQYAKQIS